jgi:hypothetical protein
MEIIFEKMDEFQGKVSGGDPGMENDLVSTKHELLRIRDMLEMAEKVTYAERQNQNLFLNVPLYQ